MNDMTLGHGNGNGAPHPERREYVRLAVEYAQAVCTGEINAVERIKPLCRRLLDDLEAFEAGTFPYIFDVARAEYTCAEAEHRFGIVLEPWQCFTVAYISGWVDADGKPRAEP
jgi:phage terminase large subunit-like protein